MLGCSPWMQQGARAQCTMQRLILSRPMNIFTYSAVSRKVCANANRWVFFSESFYVLNKGEIEGNS